MSTQGDGMADVTEADREKAKRIEWGPFGSSSGMTERIAAALAEEREKARALVLTVTEDLDRFSEDEDFEWNRTGDLQRLGARDAYDVAVTRIHAAIRAAEETE